MVSSSAVRAIVCGIQGSTEDTDGLQAAPLPEKEAVLFDTELTKAWDVRCLWFWAAQKITVLRSARIGHLLRTPEAAPATGSSYRAEGY